MPYIDSKITTEVTSDKRKILTDKLCDAIKLMHKPKEYLMIGYQDKYDLFFSGEKVENGAFVSVSVFGEPSPEDCEKFTEKLTEIYTEELGLAADKIYVAYHSCKNWGWNGTNF